MQTFANLSESDNSQSESDRDWLETDCLQQGDLCSHLAIETGHPEVKDAIRLVSQSQLVAPTTWGCRLTAKTFNATIFTFF